MSNFFLFRRNSSIFRAYISWKEPNLLRSYSQIDEFKYNTKIPITVRRCLNSKRNELYRITANEKKYWCKLWLMCAVDILLRDNLWIDFLEIATDYNAHQSKWTCSYALQGTHFYVCYWECTHQLPFFFFFFYFCWKQKRADTEKVPKMLIDCWHFIHRRQRHHSKEIGIARKHTRIYLSGHLPMYGLPLHTQTRVRQKHDFMNRKSIECMIASVWLYSSCKYDYIRKQNAIRIVFNRMPSLGSLNGCTFHINTFPKTCNGVYWWICMPLHTLFVFYNCFFVCLDVDWIIGCVYVN